MSHGDMPERTPNQARFDTAGSSSVEQRSGVRTGHAVGCEFLGIGCSAESLSGHSGKMHKQRQKHRDAHCSGRVRRDRHGAFSAEHPDTVRARFRSMIEVLLRSPKSKCFCDLQGCGDISQPVELVWSSCRKPKNSESRLPQLIRTVIITIFERHLEPLGEFRAGSAATQIFSRPAPRMQSIIHMAASICEETARGVRIRRYVAWDCGMLNLRQDPHYLAPALQACRSETCAKSRALIGPF